MPVSLIGCGGIGKTSIGPTLIDDDRIKERFGNHRRFIRCDEVQSYTDFIHRVSKVTGAGIEDAQDLSALRSFLSSTNILIILDNAETILDPQIPDALTLYSAVEELSRTKTISLVITTRISTTPPACQQLEVPALPMTSAREAFYNIWANQQQSPDIDTLLQQLDCHPLSITILATVAVQNRWDHSRLLREWGQRGISLLQTNHYPGLSTAIEPSLSSPMFTSLGSSARDILGVIAVMPQGLNENELEWIFPTVSNARDIVDTLCILSLTHRNHNFVTMLAPLREYLRPDGYSCPLFASVKHQYLTRSRNITREAGCERVSQQWLVSEEVNINFLMNHESMDITRVCHAVTKTPCATFSERDTGSSRHRYHCWPPPP